MRKTLAAVLLALSISAPALAAPCGPIPALPDTERRTEYAGIVAQTGPFSVGFQLYGDSTDYGNWLAVWVNGVLKTAVTDYTVAPASGPAFGTACLPITNAQVTFVTPQTGTIEIVGARRPRRASQVAENKGVSAHDFNQIITDLTATLRERWDRESRLLRAPPGETLSVLPPAASRAGSLLLFDGAGNPTTSSPGVGTGNVVGPGSSVNNDVACWNGTTGALLRDCGAIGTTTLTGDVTGGPAVGTVATTLANSGVAAATYGSTSQAPQIAIDAKGRITAASNQTITPASIAAVPITRNVTAGAGLTGGGALSADVTFGLGNVNNGQILANISGPAAAPIGNSLTAIIDATISSTQGSILYRNAAQWVSLAPGTNGQLLTSAGAAANPSWTTATGTGTVTSVTCDGVVITAAGTCQPHFDFVNCTFAASVASNNLTVALKDNAGSDPTAASPCTIWYRNSNAALGSWSAVSTTAALSMTINSGSTLGITNTASQCAAAAACPFRVWVVLINSGAGNVLGLVALTNASGVQPLNESTLLTTTACSACGTASSLGTVYSTATQTTKPFKILGYIDWAGLATSGVWSGGPSILQTMGPGIKRPGDVMQSVYATSSTPTTGSGTSQVAAVPSVSITPTAAANLIVARSSGDTTQPASGTVATQLFRANGGSPACTAGFGSIIATGTNASNGGTNAVSMEGLDTPGTTSQVTYSVCIKNSQAGNNAIYCNNALVSQTCAIRVEEIQG